MDEEKIASIKVVGIGDLGARTIQIMQDTGWEHVDFCSVDVQEENSKKVSWQGAVMAVILADWHQCADREAALKLLAEAKSLDVLSLAMVTIPKMEAAEVKNVPQKLLMAADAAFVLPAVPSEQADDGTDNANVLADGVRDLLGIIQPRALIAIDIEDVAKMLSGAGIVSMGKGTAAGNNAAVEAVQMAMGKMLHKDILSTGNVALVGFTAPENEMRLKELNQAVTLVHDNIHQNAKIMFGVTESGVVGQNIEVTVMATRFSL